MGVAGLILHGMSISELIEERSLNTLAAQTIKSIDIKNSANVTATVFSYHGPSTNFKRTTLPLKSSSLTWDPNCDRNTNFDESTSDGTVVRQGYDGYISDYDPFHDVIVGQNGTGKLNCFECSKHVLCYCQNRAKQINTSDAYCSYELPVDGWIQLWQGCSVTADQIMTSVYRANFHARFVLIAIVFSALNLFGSFLKLSFSVQEEEHLMIYACVGAWMINLLYLIFMLLIIATSTLGLSESKKPNCPRKLYDADDMLKQASNKNEIAFFLGLAAQFVVPIIGVCLGKCAQKTADAGIISFELTSTVIN